MTRLCPSEDGHGSSQALRRAFAEALPSASNNAADCDGRRCPRRLYL